MAPARHLRRRRADRRAGRHLPARRSTPDLTVNAQSAGILTVLVFGAGTDYALLLVARYREELRRHDDRHEAMAVALHRAGPAIIASGATVVVGMLVPAVRRDRTPPRASARSRRSASLVALAVMLTLLPALLVTVGRWVFWPARPHVGSAEPTTPRLLGPGRRPRSRGAPAPTWIVTALVLAVMALGIVQLDATGLTNKESFRGKPDVGRRRGGARRATSPPAAGTPVVVVSAADQAAEVDAAFADDRRHRRRQRDAAAAAGASVATSRAR